MTSTREDDKKIIPDVIVDKTKNCSYQRLRFFGKVSIISLDLYTLFILSLKLGKNYYFKMFINFFFNYLNFNLKFKMH